MRRWTGNGRIFSFLQFCLEVVGEELMFLYLSWNSIKLYVKNEVQPAYKTYVDLAKIQVKSFFGKEQVRYLLSLPEASSLSMGSLLCYANGIPDYDSSTVCSVFFVCFVFL